jgi:hypothetical protein
MAGRTQAVYYRDQAGKEPVNAFLDRLATTNPRAAAKIDDYIEEYLNDRDASSPPPEHPISSQVDGELRELRVRFAKTRYRRDLAIKRFDDFKARMEAKPRRRPRAAGHDAPPKTRGGMTYQN